MITRFAPSPTGLLHLGNLRTALIAYLSARVSNGSFILRIDDTDLSRVTEEYVESLFRDLEWCGIKYDQCFRQSDRFSSYNKKFEELLAIGRIYKCYETPEELEILRKSKLKRGIAPAYRQQKNGCEYEGRKPYYRFKLDLENQVSWEDGLRGIISIDLSSTSDPIIRRENGIYTYMFPSVVDDLDYNVDFIIRGEDHISNTAVQIQMFQSLGAERLPGFCHLPLLKVQEGKISKRKGGFDVDSLRKDGLEAEVIITYLLNLGSSIQNVVAPLQSWRDFSLANYAVSSSIVVDVSDVLSLNAKYLNTLSYEKVKHRLTDNIKEDFWCCIRKNINTIAEVYHWWEVCINPELEYEKNICDPEIIEAAVKFLPEVDVITSEIYKNWVMEVVNYTKASKKDVNITLRVALTGEKSGPDMGEILSFFNKKVLSIRLQSKLSDVY